MIVIRATGSADVKAVRKLARTLSAEPADISILEEEQPRPKRRRPTISPLNAASIAPAAHGAILELASRERRETADPG